MKKSRGFGSCLDLLLDTMCNAFGGIIFIAISLTVMLTFLKQAASAVPVVAPLDAAALRQELAAIEEQSRELLEAIRLTADDPRRKLAAEITALETEQRNRELRLELQRATLAELRKKQEKTAVTVAELRQKLQELQPHNTADQQELAILQQTLAALQQTITGAAGAEPLRLARLQASRKQPCFYAIWQNRLWKVGPERDANGKWALNTAAVDHTRNGNLVFCTLRPEAGKPLAASADPEQLDPAILRELQNAQDQVPFFWVAPDSAGLFFALHHQLSQQRVRHSWRPNPDPAKFTLEVSSNVVFEY